MFKRKILDYIKIKAFFAINYTIKKVEKTIPKQEKIFASYIYDERLVCRIYLKKKKKQFNDKKTNNPTKNFINYISSFYKLDILTYSLSTYAGHALS